MNFDIEKHTILKVLSGSRASGLDRPDSDYDYRGIAIPPKEYFFGFDSTFQQYPERGQKTEDDVLIYDIRKFIRLASECNPSVTELLWTPERCILINTAWGERLLASRWLFLSKAAQHTFRGYAFRQLEEIKAHHRWIFNPPKEKPTRDNFGLPKDSSASASFRKILSLAKNDKISPENILRPEVLELWSREREFFEAQKDWKDYSGWRKNRNSKRLALEGEFGYDTKNAMHLVRITRMGRELLTTGELIVERPDKEELVAIYNGAWTYEQLVEYAERGTEELSLLPCAFLPDSPDMDKLDALCVELVEDFLD